MHRWRGGIAAVKRLLAICRALHADLWGAPFAQKRDSPNW
jgi:hypothetical protein